MGTLSHGDLLTNGRAGAGALSCLPELRLRLLHNRFPTRSRSVAKFIRSFITSEVREKNGNLSTTEHDFYVANKDYIIIVYGGMDNTIIERFVGCKMFAKCVCLDYSDGHDRQDETETTLTQCPVLTVLGVDGDGV